IGRGIRGPDGTVFSRFLKLLLVHGFSVLAVIGKRLIILARALLRGGVVVAGHILTGARRLVTKASIVVAAFSRFLGLSLLFGLSRFARLFTFVGLTRLNRPVRVARRTRLFGLHNITGLRRRLFLGLP